MKVLYIGQYQTGSTSRMRGEKLKKLLTPTSFDIIDTYIPFINESRLFRSLGFRHKIGPLIRSINRYIEERLSGNYDFVWVDKGIFITPETTNRIRTLTYHLVHFTPDPAFMFHNSRLFERSLALYDFAVTTKSFELTHYERLLDKTKIILATQGYDKNVHKPVVDFHEKKEGLVFIGHHEVEREVLILHLLNHGVKVALAGIKWENFVKKNNHNHYLTYLGPSIYQDAYVKTLSAYQFGLGLLSKWIPEKHTTRTLEIPACGTALLTERNEETKSFYKEDEVIFFDTHFELVEKIKYYQTNLQELEALTQRGNVCVTKQGYDYESILHRILQQISVL
ncbi:hypothetical protein D770_01870 [Flammeovirgaceae bacterium 311]|nr:hypothetical protein D770_01870 [Flammeovirgaceae bacterium 311]